MTGKQLIAPIAGQNIVCWRSSRVFPQQVGGNIDPYITEGLVHAADNFRHQQNIITAVFTFMVPGPGKLGHGPGILRFIKGNSPATVGKGVDLLAGFFGSQGHDRTRIHAAAEKDSGVLVFIHPQGDCLPKVSEQFFPRLLFVGGNGMKGELPIAFQADLVVLEP